MMDLDHLFSVLPAKLRNELVSEFAELSSNVVEGKWRASGLNAGRFCEIAYCIIKGHADGAYPLRTKKPIDLLGKLRALENDARLPHGFRLVAPRILAAVYEVRNHRNISHVGGAVDPSFMDSSLVLAGAKWIMAEFVRELHDMPELAAQGIVDYLSQYSPPAVWADDKVRRVLDTKMPYDDRLIALLASAGGEARKGDVFFWLDHGTRHYFTKRVNGLHGARQIEAKAYGDILKLLPPGIARSGSIFARDKSAG